jgi:hypothetical protein
VFVKSLRHWQAQWYWGDFRPSFNADPLKAQIQWQCMGDGISGMEHSLSVTAEICLVHFFFIVKRTSTGRDSIFLRKQFKSVLIHAEMVIKI